MVLLFVQWVNSYRWGFRFGGVVCHCVVVRVGGGTRIVKVFLPVGLLEAVVFGHDGVIICTVGKLLSVRLSYRWCCL